MTINLKAREEEIKNSYTVKATDGKYIIMQKDFYFSETFNDYQEYYRKYKTYKTLNGAMSALKKLVSQHFPKDYFNESNDINEFVKAMI